MAMKEDGGTLVCIDQNVFSDGKAVFVIRTTQAIPVWPIGLILEKAFVKTKVILI